MQKHSQEKSDVQCYCLFCIRIMISLQQLFHKGQRWISLPQADRTLSLQAFLLLPILSGCLSLKGLQWTQGGLDKLTARCPRRTIEPSQLQHVAQIVNMAARSSRWGNCLKRSLALWFLLRCQGVETTLRIGVRREQDEFQAHAWIECQNLVLNDRSDVHQQFSAFGELDS